MPGALSAPVIEAVDLTKHYGPFAAVDHVSFRIERGEVVGFLGANGAGKTTTLRLLAGYLPPTAGKAWILGHDVLVHPGRAKRALGYLPERPPLYVEMTVRDYLLFVARVKGLPGKRARDDVDRVLAETDAFHVADRVIARLSRGYQQRVGLAQALLGEPALLLLDEPTLGLDPGQQQFVRTLVRRLGRERTILLSSHFLHEVEEVCTRVLVIRRGKLVADSPLAELTAGTGRRLAVVVGTREEASLARARELLCEGGLEVEPDPAQPGRFVVSSDGAALAPADIARRLVEAGLALEEMTPLRPQLEEVFLSLTSDPGDAPGEGPGEAPGEGPDA
jgi:ABC-2 type transport system ATP-binding protein